MQTKIEHYQQRVDQSLQSLLAFKTSDQQLTAAMRYACLDGGKRMRALLTYAAGEAVAAPLELLDRVATAVECIHSYSLIHDDLPSMDDDCLRRGKASTHIKFGEATAILAGDALLTYAFQLLSDEKSGLSDAQVRRICWHLSHASGAEGMVAGQMLDMQATGKSVTHTEIETMHRLKTGKLIVAAVLCGGLCRPNRDENTLQALRIYAENMGFAYQVIDDILDVEADTETLGKTAGADLALAKMTIPASIGLKKSRQLADKLYRQAIASLSAIGDNTALLEEIASIIIQRNH